MFNITTKLFIPLLLSLLLSSCINNGDEPDVKPPLKAIPLTKNSLSGEWEVYYFWKKIMPKGGGESNYRYTENDGFRATFTTEGVYYENNVFGHETKKGTYKIINFKKEQTDYDSKNKVFSGASENSDLEKDGLLLTYKVTDKTTKLEKDTTVLVNIPKMFDENFAFRDEYIGGAQGHSYSLLDNRDYRRVGSGFLPDEAQYKKNPIDINDLLGRWEMTSSVQRVENTVTNKPFNRDRHLFRMEGNKYAYYEFEEKDWTTSENPQANRSGDFKIFEDVVYLFVLEPVYDDDGKLIGKEWKSYSWWVKDKIDLYNGIERLRTYDKYRDVNNVLLEVEVFESYKKVSNN